MISRDPRRRRCLVPLVTHLESRRLLAVTVVSDGQNGTDIVGPDASQGSDGTQDLRLTISGLTASVDHIVVQGPTGFEWASEPDPNGYALAEYFVTSPSTDDVYINPQVKSDLPPPGGSLPLGGSTGSLIPLQDGNQLTFYIYYSGQTNYVTPAPTVTLSSSNFTSATDPITEPQTPNNVVNDFNVVYKGQDGTYHYSYEQGDAHLYVTPPTGQQTFSSNLISNFSQVVWTLSDNAGMTWDSTMSSQGHNQLDAYLESSDAVVDLYFPPVRSEAPVNGSPSNTMLLQVTLPNDPTVYVSPFMGGTANPAEITNGFNNQPAPSPDPTTESQLDADLHSESPEYDTIDLPANQTITITQPIQITHSVQIVGNNATLDFNQGSTGAWPSSAGGAIYANNSSYTDIQIELENFTIKFNMSAPIVWANPSGTQPARWDPNINAFENLNHAVIDTGDTNTSQNIQNIKLIDMTVYGPPAFQAANFPSIQAGAPSGDVYVGEPDIALVNTNGAQGMSDSGSITGSTFQGGPINLTGGPWNVTGNTILGATAYTYSTAAFALSTPHDVTLVGNTVSQSDPNGTLFRLMNISVAGENNVIEDNWVGGGVGAIGDEVQYNAADTPPEYIGLNDGELIVEEENAVIFEGRPGAVSADGRILAIQNVRAPVTETNDTAHQYVVSILSGVNSNGTANMSLAGQWFRIAQVVVNAPTGTNELLMADPLPQMPSGGYYEIEITNAFVDTSFINNTINMTKQSSGIKIDGSNFDTRIIGNQIIGNTSYSTTTTSTAMLIGAGLNSAPTSGTSLPLPLNWTALPNLGVVIEDNTIRDVVGGIQLGVEHNISWYGGTNLTTAEAGRVFLTASVTGNVFEWDQTALTSWETDYATVFNDNPAETEVPPTITVGFHFTPWPTGPYGDPRFPFTVGNVDPHLKESFFVDPAENVLAMQGNAYQIINSSGTISPQPEPSGQAYEGTINGTVVDPEVSAQSYNGTDYYYPFNIDNLNINTGQASGGGLAQSPQALMVGQDNYDLVGAGSGTPTPDGTQDLHIELTGLSPTATVQSVTVIDTSDTEQWVYPESGSSPQIVFSQGTGAPTADIFIQPTASHLDDAFTVLLTYKTGGPITIPVQGVLFNPSLPVLPTISPAPLGLGATSVTSSHVALSWTAAPGAASYIVLRSPAGSTLSWTIIAAGVTGTTYTDASVANATAYEYAVRSTSSFGNSTSVNSAFSQLFPVTTGSPADVLAATALGLSLIEGQTFSGTVATFTDTNHATPASSFTATLNWGDWLTTPGTIVGSNGSFAVSGTQTYSAFGSFALQVQIQMVAPGTATASTVSTMAVSPPVGELPLTSYFNQVGITTSGSSTEGKLGAGGNLSYSSGALGGSTIVWNSAAFQLGSANAADVVQATGQTISLNCSNCSSIELLAAATNGANQGGVFTINYSGGSYDQDTLGFSDWIQGYGSAGTNAPGETTVLKMVSFDTYSGGTNSQTGGNTYLYGYVIPSNPGKTITGLVLPNNSGIAILALDEISQPAQVNLTSYFSQVGITTSGSSVSGQFSSPSGSSFSSAALGGSTVTWGSSTFNLGPANADDVVPASGDLVALPPGNYSSIEVLAASMHGVNEAAPMNVDYSDGSVSFDTLAFSDWRYGYNGAGTDGPGESTVISMSYYNSFSGGVDTKTSGNVYVYGYTIPVNPNKTATWLAVGNNNAIVLLAIDLISQPPQLNMGYGSSSTRLPYGAVGITTSLDRRRGRPGRRGRLVLRRTEWDRQHGHLGNANVRRRPGWDQRRPRIHRRAADASARQLHES